MTDFLKMDIFFAVTTAAVFFAGVMGMVALFYVIRILRSIDHVAKNASDESDAIRVDIGALREKMREEGVRVSHLLDFFLGVRERKRAERSQKKEEVKKEVF